MLNENAPKIKTPEKDFHTFKNISSSLSTFHDLGNLEHQISPSQPMGLTVKADSDLIAIGKVENAKQFYVILTTADLDAGYSRSHTYICEHHQVLRSNMSGTCLGSISYYN